MLLARGPRLCANICDSEKACTGFCFPVTFLFRVVHFQLLPKSHLSLGDHLSRRNKVFISSLESLKVDKSRAANPSVRGIPGFVRNVDSLIPTLLPKCLLKYLPEIQQVLASAQCCQSATQTRPQLNQISRQKMDICDLSQG